MNYIGMYCYVYILGGLFNLPIYYKFIHVTTIPSVNLKSETHFIDFTVPYIFTSFFF